jgi:hypothetical protein
VCGCVEKKSVKVNEKEEEKKKKKPKVSFNL